MSEGVIKFGGMSEETLKGAIEHGKAVCRKLSPFRALVWVPDTQRAVVLIDHSPAPAFDLSKCGRMPRAEAHKAVDVMDVPPPIRAFYHDLIDSAEGRD